MIQKHNRRKMDSNENIKLLRELTEKLDVKDVVNKEFGGFVSIDICEDKKLLALNLLKIPEISVSKTYLPEGSKIAKHTNKEWELILIIEGEMTIHFDTYDKVLKPMDFYYTEPNVPHSVSCKKETILIAISIPAAEYLEIGEGVESNG